MFVFCLILNPYERVERFGPRAGTDAFTLSIALVEVSRFFYNMKDHGLRPIDAAVSSR